MTGETLHDYDIDLGNYALGNIRPYLLGVPRPDLTGKKKRIRRNPNNPKAETFAAWLAGQLHDGLESHLWTDQDERLPLLLTLTDLRDLSTVARPDYCSEWTPYEALHRRHIACVPEIRKLLTRQAAEDWSEVSGRIGEQLCEDIPVRDGIDLVLEWIRHLRFILNTAGLVQLLPRPEGQHPTPLSPKPPTPSENPIEFVDPKMADTLACLRAAIKEFGANQKAIFILRKAAVMNQRGRDGLRKLEQLEEYHGYCRPRPKCYRSNKSI